MAFKQQDNGLTVRQDRFAQCLAIGMTAVDAYRKCFPTNGKSDNAIHQAAHRLTVRTAVRVRAETFLKEAKVSDLQTGGEWAADLLDMISQAKRDKNWTACAALKRLSGQALGMLNETITVRAEQSIPDEKLVATIAGNDPAVAAALRRRMGLKVVA